MRRRKPAASTPAAALSLLVAVGAPCGRLCSHTAAAAFHQAASWSRSQAGRPGRPGPPPNLAASASARGPETGDPEREETAHWEMVTAPLPPPEEGRVEYLVFVPPLAQKPAVPKTSFKSGFLSLWVPRGGELRAVHHGIASLLLSRQAAGGCPRAPLLPIRGTR